MWKAIVVGWICGTVMGCVGEAPHALGAACVDDADCETALNCVSTSVGRMCTLECFCTGGASCLDHATCNAVDPAIGSPVFCSSTRAVCLVDCDTDADCPPRSRCELDGHICAPMP